MSAAVRSLGYWGIEASDPGAWRHFLLNQLGMVEAPKGSDGADVYRVDSYASRIRILNGPADDISFIGWEVAGAEDMAAIAEKLNAAGYPAHPGGEELASQRQVEDLIIVEDPDGIRTEIFWGPQLATRPFSSAMVPGGFMAEPNGIGHHVLVVRDRQKTMAFYCDLLGLKLSDYIRSADPERPALLVTFLHANPRHHSFAFAQVPFAPKRKMQHLAFQLANMSDVGLAYDRFLAAETPIAMTLGHHPNCHSFSFYVRSPSGIDVEYAWGTREIDDDHWVPGTYSELSDWGHKVQLELIEPKEEPAFN